MAHVFEEMRNTNGVLYKLKGKLSDYKEANVTIVPKTKLVFMHISDISKAVKNGNFDKNLAKSVSLSMNEVTVLRSLLSTMDTKVQELVNSAPQQQGKKRKLEPSENDVLSTDTLLAEFNAYQAMPSSQANLAYVQPANGSQQLPTIYD